MWKLQRNLYARALCKVLSLLRVHKCQSCDSRRGGAEDTATIKAVVGCPRGKYSGGRCSVGTQVQTIVFPKDGWTADKVRAWLRDHDVKTGLDITDDSFRARQKDPGSFDSDSFRTITLTGGGESLKHLSIRERLVPFKARILAAVPGKSMNNRIYTRELLQQSAPLYSGKPFILDHDIEHAERVVGLISNPRYATERGMDGRGYEGLWLDAVGLMDEDLFQKVQGAGRIPPLVRGVSIGGEGEGDFQADGGVMIKQFYPAELSVTAFPGIAAAHVAAINVVRESLKRSHEHEMKKSSIRVKETNVSLDEAKKQAADIKESPIPMGDNPASTVPPGDKRIYPQNYNRPGLPPVSRGKPVLHVVPQATTSADSGLKLDPEQHDTGAAPMASVGSAGASTTKSPSREIGPPGTSPDAEFQSAGQTSQVKSADRRKGNMQKTYQLMGMVHPPGGGRDVPPPGPLPYGVEDPSVGPGEGGPTGEHRGKAGTMMAKPGEEEEEEEQEEEQQEDDSPIGVEPGKEPPPRDEPAFPDKDEEEEHGPSPHIRGNPVGKKGPHAAPNAYDSPADQDGEEEEEMADNPVLKTAQRANPNPQREEETMAWSDANPNGVTARAYSLPLMWKTEAMLHLDAVRNPNFKRGTEVENAINTQMAFWNRVRNPPPPPPKKVTVKRESQDPGYAKTTIPTIQATRSPVTESSVPTKSITNLRPTEPAMQISTRVSSLDDRWQNIGESIKKEWNGAHKKFLELIASGQAGINIG